jgi:hypothetical protein
MNLRVVKAHLENHAIATDEMLICSTDEKYVGVLRKTMNTRKSVPDSLAYHGMGT